MSVWDAAKRREGGKEGGAREKGRRGRKAGRSGREGGGEGERVVKR